MRFNIITLILLLIPWLGQAQNRDRGSLSVLVEPGAHVEGGGQLTLHETRLATGLPPVRWGNHSLGISFDWTHYDFATENLTEDDFSTDSIGLSMHWGFGAKKGLSGSLILSPSLRTDFESITTDDLGLAALMLGSYPWRTNVTAVFGAVYSRSFGHDRLFPALGATWIPSPRWQLDFIFPRPRITYQAGADARYWLGLEPGGDQWNIERQGESRDLALEEYRAGLGAEWMLTRHLGFTAQSGAVFARQLEVREGKRRESEQDVGDTWYARIGLLYR